VLDSHRLGISELRSAFGRGALSPSRYVTDLLGRIDRLNPRMQAFVEIDRQAAQAAAEESDRRYAADQQRPLEGVVIGVKSSIAVAGLDLSAGMAARKGIIAERDAEVVSKLRSAGVIIIGSLNMHEGGIGATTDNPFYGRCLNPHGEGLTPGGSSGGSAAAVAAGLCTAALGSDTLGSVRIPASYCGIYGLRPTHGAISVEGLVPMSEALDSVGFFARSMDDISFLSNILIAPDLSSAMQRARYLTIADLGGVQVEPAISESYRFAVTMLPQPPEAIALPADCGRIRLAAYAGAIRDLIGHLISLGEERCGDLSEEATRIIDFALSRSAEDLAQDEALVAQVRRALRAEIGQNGILVLPTTPQTAFAQGTRAPNTQADWTALANIAGLPAISLPIGRTSELLPIGMQMVGPPGGEALLIAQARAINDRLKAYAPPTNWW
jgi:aspartyl-tRNA(Asn)/glutamyl-tRNA(Gln) amidotransferase subunit A